VKAAHFSQGHGTSRSKFGMQRYKIETTKLIQTRECLFTLEGHTDFVKSLTFYQPLGFLLSGSSDASLRIWQGHSLLHTLKGHSRGIEDIAIDWTQSSNQQVSVFTASSDRTIRRWNISKSSAAENGEPLIIHETSVYAIKVDQDDIWTCMFLKFIV